MAPKKAKGKGKKSKAPKPDAGWEKTIGNFKWERPLESLPDPQLAPNFGEIRANVLGSCKLLSIIWNARLDEAFVAELFSTPRPYLEKLEFRGAKYLRKFIMSPGSVAPALKELDLSCCAALDYVFIESNSLEKLSLARCVNLEKAHIVVRGLHEINLRDCNELSDLMLWSDKVSLLDPPQSKEKDRFEIDCPALKFYVPPGVKVVKAQVVFPPPMKELLEQDKLVEKYEMRKRRVDAGYSGVVDSPRTPYLGFNSYLQAT